MTWQNLAPYLPEVPDAQGPPRVLDAGGGSGELALQLVRRGYRVWLLDYAPAMLDQARQVAQGLPDELRSRLTLCLMSVEGAPDSFPSRFFDVITCHTLVEYVPDPRLTLRTLVDLLREGGLLSVSFVNHHAEVLRQVLSKADPAGALAGLEDGGFCATLFGIPGLAYTAGEVSGWLAALGLTVTATCGVRTFADYIPPRHLNDPGFFDALLRLEMAVANRSPYRSVARYVHLIAHKGIELS